MKFLIILLNILMVFPNAISSKKEEFEAKTKDAYDYVIYDYVEKENYVLEVCEGYCNETYSFGVFFASYESEKYFIRIMINDSEYSLEEDSRGDTMCLALPIPNGKLSVYVYDDVNGYSTKRYEYNFTHTIEEIENSNNKIMGNNQGIEFATMTRHFKTSSIIIFFVCIFLFIALVCLGIIYYMYKHGKGIFDKNKQHESDIKYFDNIEEEIDAELDEYFEALDDKKEDSISDQVEEEKEEVDIDIKPYLEKYNLNKEYKDMSEIEKNQCMIVLMYLKDENIISIKQYDKEKINLWRK